MPISMPDATGSESKSGVRVGPIRMKQTLGSRTFRRAVAALCLVMAPFVAGSIPADRFVEMVADAYASFDHPDVCPLVPISGISLEETAVFAHQLGERVITMKLLLKKKNEKIWLLADQENMKDSLKN